MLHARDSVGFGGYTARMFDAVALQDITRTIQLAIAPVFLLSAISTTMAVLSTRLGRVLDRARPIDALVLTLTGDERSVRLKELQVLERRAKLIAYALTAVVASAVLVCLLIAVAFSAYLLGVNLAPVIAILFLLAVLVFMVALVNFLREVFLGIDMMRFTEKHAAKP